MEYETAGDPISGTLWTRKTREKIAEELSKVNIEIGKTTVGKILKKMDYSLRCNSKKISNGGRRLTKEEAVKRDEQFKYIERKRNEGFVYVGRALWEKQEKRFASSETPEFAAENIARWWKDYGEKRYPEADEILILA